MCLSRFTLRDGFMTTTSESWAKRGAVRRGNSLLTLELINIFPRYLTPNSADDKTVSEQMTERGWELNSVAQRQQYIKVLDHIVHIDQRSFDTCWQAAHIRPICSGLWVGCVLTTNKLLQGWNGLKTPLLGDLSWPFVVSKILLSCIRVLLLCSHMSK